jgi:hypothetical protein
MTITHRYIGFAACFVLASSGLVAAHAEPASAIKTFLTDYSKLQPFPGKDGKDLLYIAPNVEQRAKAYTHVMVDEPEVFISPESPYQGAKPQDIAAISGLVRDATVAALKERGYQIVDKPAANVLYVRSAITDLQIQKKKRSLMAYTPAGFVVDTGLKAMKEFTEKYDVLDLALQTEAQDSLTGDVLAASVLQRGKSAGAEAAGVPTRQCARCRGPTHRLHRYRGARAAPPGDRSVNTVSGQASKEYKSRVTRLGPQRPSLTVVVRSVGRVLSSRGSSYGYA